VPAAQLVHAFWPAAEIMPREHGVQALAPASAEKLPATQFEQDEVPVELWYVPEAHAVQLPAAPAEKEPAAHAEQFPAPAADL